MKFSDIKYQRPDIDSLKAELKILTSDLQNATSYSEAREIFIKKNTLSGHIATLSTIVSVRHSIDTRDKFYDEESTFWNATSPELEEYMQEFTSAMLNSKFRPEFESEFGNLMFINAEIQLKTFSPEIISDLQVENDLVQEYEKLIASAQIPFEDKIYTIAQLGKYKSDSDDELRLKAWKADGGWYKENQPELDRIYDELVKVRDKIARKLGYDGFTELGYYRMGRNCYTKTDVEKFRKAVIKYLVPVADAIYKEQAKQLGKEYPMSFADNALEFRSGNPKPFGDADQIVAHAKKLYDELSPETSEFFNSMLDGDLLDLLSKEGKAAGGYCTSLHDYKMPFIFANFNGTSADVETVTHEAGHAFADWLNRDRIPLEYIWPSLEGCEVHSMSMEFFAWKWAEGFFGKDTQKFYYSHLAGSLKFIPYGTMVDHFQHIVYEKPEMTPAERHATWKELLGIYMPWVKLDGDIPFYADGCGWQRQTHIYQVPFYYIDYCFAQTVALQFWAMTQNDFDNAWQHYMAYTSQGGSKVFTELLESAGLDTPFDEECLRNVCKVANDWLNNFDLENIE